ncbi:PEGA domain-containing protein [Treponema primitia]|uniref:PEGA domain-containing protein n=1 Tax=Treponema primitia TaxID=88058 RepID=UPI00397EA64D
MPGKIIKHSITVLALFLVFSAPVFGFGKAEEEAAVAMNPEWALCITAFDVSSLPLPQQILGDLLMRRLAKSITDVHHRVRISDEYSYYRDLAWVRALEDAGKKLAAKRAERDLLIYKGYPGWRYKSELKTVDAAIKTLDEEYQKAEEAVMTIEYEPVFILTQENTGGLFPDPPSTGGEYHFCTNKKADAFVSGKISEFHGRIFLRIRMYTLYTRSFEYEDSFIFSTDDMGMVEDEMVGRLMAAISGAPASAISVKTDPENAVILVKENYAGQGDTGIREYPPGPVNVTAFADGYNSSSVSVDLAAGELTELQFKLQPVPKTSFDINFPNHDGASIYEGSLYMGMAPLTITTPVNQFEYIHAETPAGDRTAVIFRAGQTRDVVTLPIAIPAGKDKKPLDTARRKYYGAWTHVWIALPVAFLLSGITLNYQNAYTMSLDPDMYDTYQTLSNVTTGAWIVFSAVMVESIYRVLRYGSTASKSVPKIAK